MSKTRLVITAVVVEGRKPAEVAATYGVSRSWLYELLARYRAEGDAAFLPKSRRPKTTPNTTSATTVELILKLRWLFPGGNPGRHLATENIRSQLVQIGVKPYESRKATLFQLAAEMPAPVLAELIGITPKNASDWARLAARDWSGYIAERAR